MQPLRVEGVQQLHKVINVHGAGAHLPKPRLVQHLVHNVLDPEILGHVLADERLVDLVVLLHHEEDAGLVEFSAQGLVFAHKTDSRQSVPFLKQKYTLHMIQQIPEPSATI